MSEVFEAHRQAAYRLQGPEVVDVSTEDLDVPTPGVPTAASAPMGNRTVDVCDCASVLTGMSTQLVPPSVTPTSNRKRDFLGLPASGNDNGSLSTQPDCDDGVEWDEYNSEVEKSSDKDDSSNGCI